MKKQELELELEKTLNNLSHAQISNKTKAQILTDTLINLKVLTLEVPRPKIIQALFNMGKSK